MKRFFFYITLGLTIFYSSCLLISYFYTNSFILEILVSFLPYLLLFNGALFVFYFLIYLYIKRKHLSVLEGYIRKGGLFSAYFLLFLTTIIGTSRMYSFAYREMKGQGREPYTIAFFNKLYSNREFSQINDQLSQLKPDVIGFAEFNVDDKTRITYLENYPYKYITSCDCKFNLDAEVAIYSKLPIQDSKVLDIPETPNLVVSILLGNTNVEFVVFHPPPPISDYYLNLRDESLNTLSHRTNSKQVIMGDFNTSPWSPTYQKFQRDLSGMKDAAQGQGIVTTWGMGMIRSHIDHILVPDSFQVDSFEVRSNIGSDSLVVTKIKI
jgi:endonuclease/exonuclease/phosphatase (EEP) superfamily protein YafD